MGFNEGVMLITYPDSIGGNLQRLDSFARRHLRDSISSLHILPFYPSSGDRGFAPLDYLEVDPAFGTWEDIRHLGTTFDLVFDFMINHISRQSHFFQDYLENGDRSPYKEMFIRYSDFWPAGRPSPDDLEKIYRRKPRYPYIEVQPGNGDTERVWCTFDEEQVDLNLFSPVTRRFVQERLLFLAEQNPAVIRLDAVPYVVKKPGTSCFFLEPEIWEVLAFCRDIVQSAGIEVLPEFHEHYRYQFKLAEAGYRIYDFALPMVVLHSIYTGTVGRLSEWLRRCPAKQYTTLDTHDGIGVVDVQDILSDSEIEAARDQVYRYGANVKKRYNTPDYGNLDIYQLNCTYYSALGNSDDAYLTARAIQYFAPGIPQVYYTGLLAGENDVDLVEQTRIGRNINRHAYSLKEAEDQLKRNVVQRLLHLTRFRNTYPGFHGSVSIETPTPSSLRIRRSSGRYTTVLSADLAACRFQIDYVDPDSDGIVRLEGV